MKYKADVWISKGYEAFAYHGLSALKVEQIAKNVGISKSSFYHFFADIDIFVDELLAYHLKQSLCMANKEKEAKHIEPDLINILVEHKVDLLFNRQLRVHAHQPKFKHTLEQSNAIIGNDFVRLWLKDTGLKLTIKQAEGIFTLALENFFLLINAENLNKEWLLQYFNQLKDITKQFESENVR
ncbi:MAG: TetR/AcrR family transcriptional regulator [Bacteroidia bacterium]|jgi:AcrR family transcriptional regulator|nr:TetR/AcrR family transcriptional regulator [Bacteroidia bacterium]